MLLSVDEMVEPSASELTVELRRDLLARLGMFGIRFLVTEIVAGRVVSAGEMARALVARSGLDALRRHISEQFLPQSQVLKARTALSGLRSVARRLAGADDATGRWLGAQVEQVEASAHEFGLMRLGHLVATGLVSLRPEDRADVERMLAGGSISDRVGAASTESVDSLRARALGGLERWRERGADPLADGAASEAAQTMARAYETLYVVLQPSPPPGPERTPWPPPTS
jgi:hypothetical protein